MRKFLAVALSISLIVPVPAMAQNCRTTYNASYVQPVYAQKVVAYDYNQIIVPQAFAVVQSYVPQSYVPQSFYLGIADTARDDAALDRLAEKLAKITDIQRQALAAGTPANSLPLTTKPISKIGSILSNRCASCHAPGKQLPDLSGDPDAISELVRLQAFSAAARGEMPKGKPPLPQDEFNELGAWSKLKPNGLVPQALLTPREIPKAKPDPMEPKK